MTKLEEKLCELGYIKYENTNKYIKLCKANFLVITLTEDLKIISSSVIETIFNANIEEISKARLKQDLEVLKGCEE